jgi:hypothetical protein
VAVSYRAVLLLVAGCESGPGPIDQHTSEARQKYPTFAALYAGDQGIYRGCGPNNGVCHNANEFPDLDSVGSVLDNLDRRCNEKRTSAEVVDDLCESKGDRLRIGDARFELGWIVPDRAADGTVIERQWRIHLRTAPLELGSDATIMRGDQDMWHLARYGTTALDPKDDSAVLLSLPPPPATGEDPAKFLLAALENAGVPSQPEAIQVGDPNRNELFGAALGGRLIKPGDPAGSYLLHRLTDPSTGPLMPRANCCGWSLAAVRALWCWVDGLKADGGNAMSPIDYDHCSSSPNVDLLYPEPGPGCESAGACPVRVDLDDGARFPALYSGIFAARCSGAICHDRGEVAGVDFSTEARAFATLRTKVVPGDPDASILYRRISPDLCGGDCLLMPLGRDPLPSAERDLVRAWIEAGVPSE